MNTHPSIPPKASGAEELAASLAELLADRESDLSYEFDARVAAERLNDALSDLAAYSEHDDHYDCDAQTCACGLDRAQARVKAARAAWEAVAGKGTPHARVVALGRATLAYERAKTADGPRAQGVYDARLAYLEALAAALGEARGAALFGEGAGQ